MALMASTRIKQLWSRRSSFVTIYKPSTAQLRRDALYSQLSTAQTERDAPQYICRHHFITFRVIPYEVRTKPNLDISPGCLHRFDSRYFWEYLNNYMYHEYLNNFKLQLPSPKDLRDTVWPSNNRANCCTRKLQTLIYREFER